MDLTEIKCGGADFQEVNEPAQKIGRDTRIPDLDPRLASEFGRTEIRMKE